MIINEKEKTVIVNFYTLLFTIKKEKLNIDDLTINYELKKVGKLSKVKVLSLIDNSKNEKYILTPQYFIWDEKEIFKIYKLIESLKN